MKIPDIKKALETVDHLMSKTVWTFIVILNIFLFIIVRKKGS